MLGIARICSNPQVLLQRSTAICRRYCAKHVRSRFVRLAHGRSNVVRILRGVRMDLHGFSKHCQICYVVSHDCIDQPQSLSQRDWLRWETDHPQGMGGAGFWPLFVSHQLGAGVWARPDLLGFAWICSDVLGSARNSKFRCSAQPPFLIDIVPNDVQRRMSGH